MATHSKADLERGRLSRVMRGVTSVALSALLVVAVLLVLLGIFARPGKDGISRVGGHPLLTVLSGSMVPVFHPGDMIIDNSISAAQAGRLAAGDIITFHVPGSTTELITHRIVAVKHANGGVVYQTKGDANNAADADPVLPQQVVGTYRGHIRFAGYALRAVRNKTVVFLLIFVPLLYLVFGWIAKHWGEPKTDDGSESPSPAGEALDIADEQEPAHAWAASAVNPTHSPPSRGSAPEGGAHQL
jgi:signal peptidase